MKMLFPPIDFDAFHREELPRRIAVVDPSGDGQGRFRILVVPDPEDEP